jgi:hypothetical protein
MGEEQQSTASGGEAGGGGGLGTVKRHGALSLLASWRDGLFRRQPRDRVLDLVLENAAARYAQ